MRQCVPSYLRQGRGRAAEQDKPQGAQTVRQIERDAQHTTTTTHTTHTERGHTAHTTTREEQQHNKQDTTITHNNTARGTHNTAREHSTAQQRSIVRFACPHSTGLLNTLYNNTKYNNKTTTKD